MSIELKAAQAADGKLGRAPDNDALPAQDWFESEESTRVAMVSELQRIKHHTHIQP